MSNQLDKILKKSFEDARKKPSGKVWEQIEKELLYKKQKKKIFWMRITAGIALLFGLSSFFFNSFQGDSVLPQAAIGTDHSTEQLVDTDHTPIEATKEQDSFETAPVESSAIATTQHNTTLLNQTKTIPSKSLEKLHIAPTPSTLAYERKEAGSMQSNNTFEGTLASNDDAPKQRDETIIRLTAQKKRLSTKNTSAIDRSSETTYYNSIFASTDDQQRTGEKIYSYTGEESNNSQWVLGGFYAADSPEEYELQDVGTALSTVNGEASFQSTQSYSRGITVAYRINDKFEVNTGITMANRSGYSESNANFYASTEIGTNLGTVDSEGFNTGQYTDKEILADLVTDKNIENTNTIDYQFLEIPLTLQYNFYEGKKVKSFVNTGMSAQITSEYTVTNNDGLVLENQSDIPTQMNALIGAGFEYKVHKKLGFRLNPMMKLYLGDQELNSGKQYYMSFNTGLNYNF